VIFTARLTMNLPGNSPEDAEKRLASKLPPGWTFHIEEIHLSDAQPAPITGTANLKLPTPSALVARLTNGR